jgi:3-oxoacyl-[acyl-carrier protein] reductase
MSASTSSTRILDGKVAIVTGAARGIGKATASLLATHGANVLLCDLDAHRLTAASQEVGRQSAVFAADITEDGAPEALVQDALRRWDALDIIVNNAGYSLNGPLAQMSNDRWHRMLDVHATAPMAILRAAAPHLLQAAADDRAHGREVFRKVVNVASLAVLGSEGRANYAAAKAALVGLTLSLAKEWGPSKINLNVVCPGVVGTRLIVGAEPGDTLDIDGESVPVGQPQAVIDQLTAQIPFGRLATPEDLAGSIFLFCTPWSDWITGQVLHVSGGQVYGM